MMKTDDFLPEGSYGTLPSVRQALHSLEELGYDASMVKVAKVEEQEGFDEGADGTPVGTGGAVDANDDGIIDVTGDVVDK